MAGDTLRPLSTEEAKARLRAAAQQASPSSWVRRHPLPAVAVALVAGFAVARANVPRVGSLLLAQKFLAPLIVEAARRR